MIGRSTESLALLIFRLNGVQQGPPLLSQNPPANQAGQGEQHDARNAAIQQQRALQIPSWAASSCRRTISLSGAAEVL